MLFIAPVFPIMVARIARHGMVTPACIAAAFAGPVIATSLLSHAAAPAVYVVLSGLTLVGVSLVGIPIRRPAGGGRVAT